MQLLLLLIISVFASNETEAARYSEPNILENSILVKIEEEEYNKTKKSNYAGLTYNEPSKSWRAYRYSKNEKKTFYNGSYKDEIISAHASDTLARKLIANGEKEHIINFPHDETEVYPPEKQSKYIGVSYNKSKWGTWRWSKNNQILVHNGTSYKDEKTAAHASDTLARKLIAEGEKGHKLNFPDDETEVHPEKKNNYFGVYYHERKKIWGVERWSKDKYGTVYNGYYKNENTAAYASDTLARKLIKNGEKGHKLNFPEDKYEVYPKKSSNYIGVSYNEQRATWTTQRWSKKQSKNVLNGHYKTEETAAHASDTLARMLIANGEKGHKINFPDDNTEVYHGESLQNKRQRSAEFDNSQKCENALNKFE